MTDDLDMSFVSLTDKAYQRISRAIADLELKPGETLTQDRLARWLAISRTPVREALRRLEQEGVIQQTPDRGLVVTELTVRDVVDMLELLRLMEAQAAAFAASRRSEEQAGALLAAAQALHSAAQRSDVAAWSEVDAPYHRALLEACGNQLLRRLIHDVRRRLHRITIHSDTRPERLRLCADEHLGIAEAIVRGDVEVARRLMEHHIDNLSESALALIRGYIIPVRGERF